MQVPKKYDKQHNGTWGRSEEREETARNTFNKMKYILRY